MLFHSRTEHSPNVAKHKAITKQYIAKPRLYITIRHKTFTLQCHTMPIQYNATRHYAFNVAIPYFALTWLISTLPLPFRAVHSLYPANRYIAFGYTEPYETKPQHRYAIHDLDFTSSYKTKQNKAFAVLYTAKP